MRSLFVLFGFIIHVENWVVEANSLRSPYVGDVKKSLMTNIPLYDKAGNEMGKNWWEPKFRVPIDDTTGPDPYGFNPFARHKTEFEDPRYNPSAMKIPDFQGSPMTWPMPIVQGKPGLQQHPNRVEEQHTQKPIESNELAPGCTRKGMWPCGWGVYKKPQMVIYNGIKYCCPRKI